MDSMVWALHYFSFWCHRKGGKMPLWHGKPTVKKRVYRKEMRNKKGVLKPCPCMRWQMGKEGVAKQKGAHGWAGAHALSSWLAFVGPLVFWLFGPYLMVKPKSCEALSSLRSLRQYLVLTEYCEKGPNMIRATLGEVFFFQKTGASNFFLAVGGFF